LATWSRLGKGLRKRVGVARLGLNAPSGVEDLLATRPAGASAAQGSPPHFHEELFSDTTMSPYIRADTDTLAPQPHHESTQLR